MFFSSPGWISDGSVLRVLTRTSNNVNSCETRQWYPAVIQYTHTYSPLCYHGDAGYQTVRCCAENWDVFGSKYPANLCWTTMFTLCSLVIAVTQNSVHPFHQWFLNLEPCKQVFILDTSAEWFTGQTWEREKSEEERKKRKKWGEWSIKHIQKKCRV